MNVLDVLKILIVFNVLKILIVFNVLKILMVFNSLKILIVLNVLKMLIVFNVLKILIVFKALKGRPWWCQGADVSCLEELPMFFVCRVRPDGSVEVCGGGRWGGHKTCLGDQKQRHCSHSNIF